MFLCMFAPVLALIWPTDQQCTFWSMDQKKNICYEGVIIIRSNKFPLLGWADEIWLQLMKHSQADRELISLGERIQPTMSEIDSCSFFSFLDLDALLSLTKKLLHVVSRNYCKIINGAMQCNAIHESFFVWQRRFFFLGQRIQSTMTGFLGLFLLDDGTKNYFTLFLAIIVRRSKERCNTM